MKDTRAMQVGRNGVDPTMPIAIAGMSCRFPGEATNPQNLWQMCREARDAWSTIPKDRFNQDAFYHPDASRNGASNVRGAHFIAEDLSLFDAPFFSMTPAEAAVGSFPADDLGGIPITKVAGSDTSCFVGSFCRDWSDIMMRDPDSVPMYQATGGGHALLSNRISYFFNMRGPSVSIDTACSASLVALHLACQSIKSGESRQAIVGGANHDEVGGDDNDYLVANKGRFLSPDGRSYTYDHRANGYARGEGAACLVLKSLADAVRDGDPIRAIIRNSGVNQDGKTNGITLPSGDAQSSLITSVYETAGLDPLETSYVEAHGTGTAAGDPIEASALAKVFCKDRSLDQSLPVGSIKTNIGHLEGASGLAGVIKTVLMLENKFIVPNTNFEKANPNIPLDDWRLTVPTKGYDWPSTGIRRASINSFGYGGTNAHVVIDEAEAYLHAKSPISSPNRQGSIQETRGSNTFTNGHTNDETNLGYVKPKNGIGEAGLHDSPLEPQGPAFDAEASSEDPDRHSKSDLSNGTNGIKAKITENKDHFEDESLAKVRGVSTVNGFGKGYTNGHATAEPPNGFESSRAKEIERPSKVNGNQINGTINGTVDGHSDRLAEEILNRILCFSAFDETSGKRQAKNIREYVEAKRSSNVHDDVLLRGLAYTLGERRSVLPWKAAISVSTLDQLVDLLGSGDLKFSQSTKAPTVAFCFTGQGAQWYGMGRELMQFYPAFRKSIAKSSQILDLLGATWNLEDELQKDQRSSRVNSAELSQPICTAIQVALVDLLRTWGVEPRAVIGHSSGEIAAAYATGALTHEFALSVAYHRGLTVSSLKETSSTVKGAMMAVGLSADEATEYLQQLRSGKAVIACYNSPRSLTISGDDEAISELHTLLHEKNVFCRRLIVDTAYHSHHMKPVSDQYLNAIREVEAKPSSVDFYSTVAATRLDTSALSPTYWVDNMLSPVRFSDALRDLCLGVKASKRRGKRGSSAVDIVVEIGPHSALAGPFKQIVQSETQLASSVTYLPTLVRERDAVVTLQALASRLFERGSPLKMAAVNLTNRTPQPNVLKDLPPYSWNHSTSYWAESPESRRYRQRPHPRHDLLGVQVRQSNSLEPQWRNLIRPSEIPWVRDHRVEDNIVFPAAGFLCAAIEAANQKAKLTNDCNIESFHLREVSIGAALMVPENADETEVFFSLRPYNENSRGSSDSWEEFRVFSSSVEGSSIEHCRGLISLSKASSGKSSNASLSLEEGYLHRRHDSESTCSNSVDVKEMYDGLQKIGLDYGPIFARVQIARSGPGKSFAIVSIPDTASVMPAHFEHPFILHPATLDSCFHALFPAVTSRSGPLKQPVLPTFIDNMSVSANIVQTPGHELTVCCENNGTSYRQTSSSILVFDGESTSPAIAIHGFVTTSLSKVGGPDPISNQKRLCFQTVWEADPDLLSAEQVVDICTTSKPPPEESEHAKALEQAAFYYVENVLQQLPTDATSRMLPHHQKLYSEIIKFREAVHAGRLDYDTTSWVSLEQAERTTFLERVKTSGDEGRLLAQVGENLRQIFMQEVDPLSVMMSDDRLARYYRNNVRMARQYEQGASYINLLAHKNPHLKILEIGAGTGGASFPALIALGGSDGSLARFVSYDFTDISSGWFEEAKEKAAPWGDLVSFKKLDIESDPTEQGFEAGSYDLIMAANVLHATKSMERTLTNVRKLLKKGGSLVLTELTQKRASMTVLFGILPGWWLGEEKHRETSPLMSEDEWSRVLRQTGFTGVDTSIWDTPDLSAHHESVLISRARVEKEAQSPPQVVLVSDGEVSSNAAQHLANELKKPVETVSTSRLAELDPSGKICVILNELDKSVLRDPNSDEFEMVKKVFSEADGIIWVTRRTSDPTSIPDASLAVGLARTARTEIGNTLIVTLEVDGTTTISIPRVVEFVSSIFAKNFLETRDQATTDVEYVEKDGLLTIPRVREDVKLSSFADSRSGTQVLEDQPFYQSDRPLRLDIGTPGLLDTLHFVDDERTTVPLPDDEVEIEVKASGVNFRDVMMAMGQIDVQGLGGECCGIVSAVGSKVTRLKVGDRVVAFVDGSFANYCRWPAKGVETIPDDMPFEIGATLPIVYCTAFHSIKVANLVAGESVLIHAASGGLGQALIMLCQNIGAEIFTTVGTAEKRAFLQSQFGIPDDHIFSSRDESFATDVMRMTKQKGIDVIFNSVSGDLLRRTFECIASFGRFIELGKKDFAVNSRLEMKSFARNVTFSAIDLVTLLAGKPEYGSKMWTEVMGLVRSGVVKPPQPITVFGISEVEKALRTMQSGKHIGKLVIVPQAEEVVKVVPRSASTSLLQSDSSYLLVGGLGGLGRAIAQWMIYHGARSLIFLSPSGSSKPAAKDTVRILEDQGVKVTVFACDVGDIEAFQNVMEDLQHLPPVCGIIQMAMVMRNSMFKNMSLEDWNDSLKPKVQGTWNLHNAFAKTKLDFFLMLSSGVGILGNASQGGYGAASTFLDSFAEYRHTLGLTATTIDIGMVAGVGYVAENEKVRVSLERQGFDSIREDELMALMEAAFLNLDRSPASGSVITGLGAWHEGESRAVFSTPRFSHFRRMALGASYNDMSGANSATGVRDALRQAKSMDDATTIVCDAIMAKMSSLLMLPLEDIAPTRSMQEYGMDSLVAVEMRNWITNNLGATIPVLEMLGNASLRALSTGIVKKSSMVDATSLEKVEHAELN
ncbi:MAG: hypothetical protein Q9157_006092 [Trypethelium eluteriae]